MRICAIILSVILVFTFVGCSDTTSNTVYGDPAISSDSSQSEASTSKESPKVEKNYQTVLDDYTKKLADAVPGLIEEYNAEAENNDKGLEGLAELSNSKIAALAEISNAGVQEMAELMLTTGSGKYEEYEEWSKKLMDVYMAEAAKITDAYMQSAME